VAEKENKKKSKMKGKKRKEAALIAGNARPYDKAIWLI
jgi:hypothetical protein